MRRHLTPATFERTMWVFGLFVVIAIGVLIFAARLISSAPDDPPPP
jgi:hypothetical protein